MFAGKHNKLLHRLLQINRPRSLNLKLSGGDALMGNTRTHAEHEG